jgi:sugar lactone lactonase YvrE
MTNAFRAHFGTRAPVLRRRRPWLLACGAVLVAAVASVAASAATVPVSTFVSLDPSAGEFTEGLAIDHRGNLYVGVAFQGAILKFAPDGTRSTLATLDVGDGLLVGLAADADGDVYAALDSFDPATQGIWRVSRTGTVARIAALDPNGFPNGLAFDDHGNLYVTDSTLGTIWRIRACGRTATAWSTSPLLAPRPGPDGGTGANGIALWHGSVYVSNSDDNSIVRIRMNPDGSAGAATTYARSPAIGDADGIAFDSRGRLYVASSFRSNTLVRLAPDGTIQTLATAADGLDYTASVAFGTSHGERGDLYFTNAGVNFGTPSVMKADVGVGGSLEDGQATTCRAGGMR